MAMAIRRDWLEDGSFLVKFVEDYIRTRYTSYGDVVDEWLDEIYRIHRRRLHRLVVGLDVEWRPRSLFDAADPPVAVLQICVGRRCLVFQILHADYIPDALFDFFADERFTFVGVGVHDDADKLADGYGLEVECAEDLRDLAAETLGKPALRGAGLQALVREVMCVQMPKPYHVRVSAWDARTLSCEQITYACADAFASFEVGRRLYAGDF
ncbi:hypothetical protein ACP4OV_024618 [Aristida adscensionis]